MNLEGVAEPPGGIFLVPWVKPVARGLGGSAAGWGLLVGGHGFLGRKRCTPTNKICRGATLAPSGFRPLAWA